MFMRIVLGAGLFLFLGLAMVAVAPAENVRPTPGAPLEPKMTPDLNVGKMNYDRFCAACHGKTARGTKKGPTFISRIYHPGHHGDQSFYVAAKRGARAHHWRFGDMKPVAGINNGQIATIIDYVRAVQKANGLF